MKLMLSSGKLSLADLRRAWREPVEVILDAECYKRIDAAAEVVATAVAEGQTVYGVNTGFGRLVRERISQSELELLQRSLVLSHAAGVGPLLSEDQSRLLMLLKIGGLALGNSGVRREVVEALLRLVNHEVYPCVPAKGSCGASGDLAPLAHMTLLLLGEGEALHRGRRIPAVEGLKLAGLSPLTLGPKEGLSLLNGTQFSTALCLEGLFRTEEVFAAAVVAGSLAVEAALGSRTPFDPRLHEVRRNPYQIAAAAAYRHLLGPQSEIGRSHVACNRVQDPYSLRCQPQVMGACLEQMCHAAATLSYEINAATDNPLVFAEEGAILSGGNFHGQPIAFAADNLALALAEIGALSERRIALLMDSAQSGLPPFLVKHSGVNSGFMIAQVTAAALAGENKSLAHPASVDSLPTSANQEDHVSMSANAARRLGEMAFNTSAIVAIELLAACQGVDFRAPLKTSLRLEEAKALVRNRVPFLEQDRFFAPDIAAVGELVNRGVFNAFMPSGLLPSGG